MSEKNENKKKITFPEIINWLEASLAELRPTDKNPDNAPTGLTDEEVKIVYKNGWEPKEIRARKATLVSNPLDQPNEAFTINPLEKTKIQARKEEIEKAAANALENAKNEAKNKIDEFVIEFDLPEGKDEEFSLNSEKEIDSADTVEKVIELEAEWTSKIALEQIQYALANVRENSVKITKIVEANLEEENQNYSQQLVGADVATATRIRSDLIDDIEIKITDAEINDVIRELFIRDTEENLVKIEDTPWKIELSQFTTDSGKIEWKEYLQNHWDLIKGDAIPYQQINSELTTQLINQVIGTEGTDDTPRVNGKDNEGNELTELSRNEKSLLRNAIIRDLNTIDKDKGIYIIDAETFVEEVKLIAERNLARSIQEKVDLITNRVNELSSNEKNNLRREIEGILTWKNETNSNRKRAFQRFDKGKDNEGESVLRIALSDLGAAEKEEDLNLTKEEAKKYNELFQKIKNAKSLEELEPLGREIGTLKYQLLLWAKNELEEKFTDYEEKKDYEFSENSLIKHYLLKKEELKKTIESTLDSPDWKDKTDIFEAEYTASVLEIERKRRATLNALFDYQEAILTEIPTDWKKIPANLGKVVKREDWEHYLSYVNYTNELATRGEEVEKLISELRNKKIVSRLAKNEEKDAEITRLQTLLKEDLTTTPPRRHDITEEELTEKLKINGLYNDDNEPSLRALKDKLEDKQLELFKGLMLYVNFKGKEWGEELNETNRNLITNSTKDNLNENLAKVQKWFDFREDFKEAKIAESEVPFDITNETIDSYRREKATDWTGNRAGSAYLNDWKPAGSIGDNGLGKIGDKGANVYEVWRIKKNIAEIIEPIRTKMEEAVASKNFFNRIKELDTWYESKWSKDNEDRQKALATIMTDGDKSIKLKLESKLKDLSETEKDNILAEIKVEGEKKNPNFSSIDDKITFIWDYLSTTSQEEIRKLREDTEGWTTFFADPEGDDTKAITDANLKTGWKDSQLTPTRSTGPDSQADTAHSRHWRDLRNNNGANGDADNKGGRINNRTAGAPTFTYTSYAIATNNINPLNHDQDQLDAAHQL
ncbi:hypothetical protein [endosymbiont GvMRE of Glomus versiforme]|uniref:hypothetical protein n=1 Tax=endosymbiont GvMRE of Glomus versiforme TaxID=2039283 RepID=UPI000EE5A6BD|nr:hypothetical protein [endosymbiont GvMRE of Glomus versiforme]RHZ35775.1 hypothetical protein GvMRE_Ic5g59 [endosymbiont GvMRE of Glomus versiforme]